jgi:hypothetical protein
MDEMLIRVLDDFGFGIEGSVVTPFGSGLIHRTWRVQDIKGQVYILQLVNDKVFINPDDIAHNISIIGSFLEKKRPDAIFPQPLQTVFGGAYSRSGGGYYRMFPFIAGTHTIDICTKSDQAFEASRQFGLFTAMLNDLDLDMLRHTITGFHDISLRYQQFMEALEKGDVFRKEESKEGIGFLLENRGIVDRFESIRKDPTFRLRVTHHDTKISNVLLDEQERGVCVIDLDTVMPGYIFSDLGDMMRTYLSPVSEEENDFSKIDVRPEFFEAIVEGYAGAMQSILTKEEHRSIFYAGEFMIYMQALRFLTDHLNNDRYYGAAYTGHNFVRGMNQVRLLQRYQEMKNDLEKIAIRITGQ